MSAGRVFRKEHVLGAAALAAAAASGFLASTALGLGAKTAVVTTTISVATGPQGPAGVAGPPGPAGPPGSVSCPAGFEPGVLVINHPGGQTSVYACLKT